MKSLTIAALLLSTHAFLCAQDVVVKGNTKLNTDFSKYKTYSWAQMDITPIEGDYEIYSYTEKIPSSKTVRFKPGNRLKDAVK